MPRYEYVVARFKRYDSWIKHKAYTDEYIFRPVWSTRRAWYTTAFILAIIALLGAMLAAILYFPAKKVTRLTMEEYGALLRQNRENNLPLTATACSNGIIGEINHDEIYWVATDYSPKRWVAPYKLPQSAWAQQCRPPIYVQYQRLVAVMLPGIILSLLYFAANYGAMWQRWHKIGIVSIRPQGETVIISHHDTEISPTDYEQIDTQFDLPTDHIVLRQVLNRTGILLALSIATAIFAAFV